MLLIFTTKIGKISAIGVGGGVSKPNPSSRDAAISLHLMNLLIYFILPYIRFMRYLLHFKLDGLCWGPLKAKLRIMVRETA